MAVRREVAEAAQTGGELTTSHLVAIQLLEALGTRYDTIQDFVKDLEKVPPKLQR